MALSLSFQKAFTKKAGRAFLIESGLLRPIVLIFKTRAGLLLWSRYVTMRKRDLKDYRC